MEEYGIVVSLASLVILLAIPINSIAPTLTSFAATHFAKKEYELAKSLFIKTMRIVGLLGFGLFIIFCLFHSQIGHFFNIDNSLFVIIAGMTILFAYVGIVNASLLQAKLSFNFLSASNFLGALLKLTMLIALLALGFGVYGALFATLAAYVFPFAIAFIPLRHLLKTKAKATKELQFKDIVSYGVPSAIATFGLTSLVSTDVLLVKHFFTQFDAGLYAGLSLVGKVIFFFTSPIGIVMFPLIVQKIAKKESYQSILMIAILIVLGSSLAITVFYFLFPDFAIHFFLGNTQYQNIKGSLGLYALFISVYSIVSLFVYYFLSIKKTSIYIPVGLAAIAQFVSILFFHSNFFDVIFSSLVITAILLCILIFYYLRQYSKKSS